MNSSRMGKLAGAVVLVGGLAAAGTPALAAGNSGTVNVTFATAAGCGTCRTLVLSNYDGSSLTGLDLSSGANGFIADVQDTGIDPSALGNFSVFATMSNLYAYDTTTKTWNCNVSIPSSAVQMSSAPSLLNASNLSASVQPVFKIAGNIGSLIDSTVTTLLPGITISTTPVINNVQSETNAALSQADQAAGSALTNLTGSLLAGLPINLTSGQGGAFTNPAAPPTGSNCSSAGGSATQVPVLNGALNAATPAPLLADIQSKLGSLSVTQMIADHLLDANTALNLISSATNIPAVDLGTGGPLSGLLTSIEDTLTGTITGLVDSVTTITGNYGAQPAMAITAPGAAPASYQGLLTVTLTSGS